MENGEMRQVDEEINHFKSSSERDVTSNSTILLLLFDSTLSATLGDTAVPTRGRSCMAGITCVVDQLPVLLHGCAESDLRAWLMG